MEQPLLPSNFHHLIWDLDPIVPIFFLAAARLSVRRRRTCVLPPRAGGPVDHYVHVLLDALALAAQEFARSIAGGRGRRVRRLSAIRGWKDIAAMGGRHSIAIIFAAAAVGRHYMLNRG